MKKTLITILIILILVGVGYLVYTNKNKVCTTDAPMAKNIKTGEIRGFSNGCIPRGWERVSSNEVSINEEIKIISDLNFTSDNYTIDLIKDNFATGIYYDAHYIAIKKDDKWSILVGFQDDPDCKILKDNNVPTEIYGGPCYNLNEKKDDIIIKDQINNEENQDTVVVNQGPLNTGNPPTITYMCNGLVKIMRYQDSPSLPPRVSYLRVSDNASIASYGDFGAYIRPEYFSIDRSKIEEGYSFNEINFCKYLKN